MRKNSLLASITAVVLTAGAVNAAQAEEKSGLGWLLDAIMGPPENPPTGSTTPAGAAAGVSQDAGRGSDDASGAPRNSIY